MKGGSDQRNNYSVNRLTFCLWPAEKLMKFLRKEILHWQKSGKEPGLANLVSKESENGAGIDCTEKCAFLFPKRLKLLTEQW